MAAGENMNLDFHFLAVTNQSLKLDVWHFDVETSRNAY